MKDETVDGGKGNERKCKMGSGGKLRAANEANEGSIGGNVGVRGEGRIITTLEER